MNIVNIQQVDFCYSPRQPLLSGLNLQLEGGYIHGLLGKNGEGKSTLLKLVAGLVCPQRGSIATLGFAPQKRLPEMLRDIFFFAEEMPTYNLSIRRFERVYAPFYPKFSAEQFDRNLREFSIASKDAGMGKLSYGQRKKVIVAFGLAANTRLLLMDEPTNGLDIPSKGQFRRLVASAVDGERGIVISTHQVRDLDSLIDSVIIMDEHKIVLNQTTKAIAGRLQQEGKIDLELLFNETVSGCEDLRI
jgi:ABC-2 type transport system ATP-binding protein